MSSNLIISTLATRSIGDLCLTSNKTIRFRPSEISFIVVASQQVDFNELLHYSATCAATGDKEACLWHRRKKSHVSWSTPVATVAVDSLPVGLSCPSKTHVDRAALHTGRSGCRFTEPSRSILEATSNLLLANRLQVTTIQSAHRSCRRHTQCSLSFSLTQT